MAETEPEEMRMATGGIRKQQWILPTALALEKDKTYGVNLYVDYVAVEIEAGGRTVSIESGMAKLINWIEMKDIEEQAVEDEVGALLDSDVVPEEVEDEKGNKIKLTDEEREDRARDMAEQGDLEYGFETLEALASDIGDDDMIPAIFRKEVHTFWSFEGWEGTSGAKAEDEIAWLGPEEQEFLNTVHEAARKIVIDEDETPKTLKAYALAVGEIMDRLGRQDFMATFRKVIPVWSYMRLKYKLKDKDIKKDMTATDLSEHKERLEQMRYWLRSHKLEMAEAARRMLDKKEIPGAGPKSTTKGKQMTVEMKKAKIKPRFNPDITDDLVDYYHAVGVDPEVPVGWLVAQGVTPEQIAEAADQLLKADRIDPPDYWAITAALAGSDYHMGVAPISNPSPDELATHEKLKKALHEKHGKLPDQVDKAFKKLRHLHKEKTDEEVMDMVREELGLKRRRNPSFKNAKEALKDALKRITTIEVVEYKPYEPSEIRPVEYIPYQPPQTKPTVEQSMESLEQTAEEAVIEEEQEEVAEAFRGLRADYAGHEWKQMLEQERQEHPTLPEEDIRTLVEDHLRLRKRENPSVEDKVIKAFWEEREARGPKATPMHSTDSTAERRDEVEVHGGTFTRLSIVRYLLWGNLIASLGHDEQGHKTLSVSSAGWETNLTNERLGSILREGEKHYPILKKFRIGKERGAMWLYKVRRLKKPDPEKSWLTVEWDDVCRIAPTMYPLDEMKGKLPKYTTYIDLEATLKENIDRLTGRGIKQELEEMELPVDTLEEVQNAIDGIEKGIVEYRAENRDFDSTPIEIAEKLGTRQKFEELLKQRDELMWRGNPKIPYTPPDAPDVEVKCPITGKETWSCTQCALFKGRSEQFIECRAKKGGKYYLAKARDKRGTVWDTYVLPRDQRKTGIKTRAIGGD